MIDSYHDSLIKYIVNAQKYLETTFSDLLYLPKPFLMKVLKERMKLEEAIQKEMKKREKHGDYTQIGIGGELWMR